MSPHKALSTPRPAPTSRTPSKSSNLPTTTHHTMSHPVLDTKDRRSYEHSRQKHLHPSDRYAARTKHYKMRVGNSKKEYINPAHTSGVRWVDPITSDDLDVHSDPDYVGPYEEDVRWGVDHSRGAEIVPLEVSLTDLIRPIRKRKGIAKDYEFVPRVRTVMVVDDRLSDSDSDSSPNGLVDDSDDNDALDWEVVPGLDKRRELRSTPPKSPTYAAVTRAE